jgi:hypothetical protein
MMIRNVRRVSTPAPIEREIAEKILPLCVAHKQATNNFPFTSSSFYVKKGGNFLASPEPSRDQ